MEIACFLSLGIHVQNWQRLILEVEEGSNPSAPTIKSIT